jgi:phage terminase large subunit-like protein
MAEKPEKEIALRNLLKEIERRKKYKAMDFFTPYPKQGEFFALGATKRERLFMAGNQLGKTEGGAAEANFHLTGLYPSAGQIFYPDTPATRMAGLAGMDAYPNGWQGRRFDKPTRGWLCAETSLLARDVLQKKLCGEPGVTTAFGTGMIPKELFTDRPSLARGITDAYDTIQVRHISGGISVARFKSYEQGRTKFQGETLDWFWGDEEPPPDVYSELLTRITATKGCGFVTFTPLKGMSEVVSRFLNEPSEDRGVVTMTIEDALHIPPEERERIISGYPLHEREARARGVPMLGSGRIFPVAEEVIRVEAFDVPRHWPKVWGIDFGGGGDTGHPFGAALLAWDRDADCLYVTHVVRTRDGRPLDHAKAMKPHGADIPVAWPRDGKNRESGSGIPLSKYYKDEGLHMHLEHATWPDGSVSTEAGIQEMYDRMTTGRLKVFAHLADWFEEFRTYHRKEGLIVKLRDDLMSATRIGVMMKRIAKVAGAPKAQPVNVRRQVDVMQRVSATTPRTSLFARR